MKKLFLSVVTFISFNTQSENALQDLIAKDASIWASQVVSQFNEHELQIVGNFLYCDFIASFYDMKVRATLSVLQELLPIANDKISAMHDDAHQHVTQLAVYVNTLNDQLLNKHQKAYKRWALCCQTIEAENNTRLIQSIEQVTHYIKSLMFQMLAQYKKDLQTTYGTLKSNFEELSKEFNQHHALFQELINKENPIENETERDIVDFNIALNIAHKTTERNTELLHPLYSVQRMGIALLELNTNIFGLFYNEFEKELSKRSEHFYIMFDENGILAQDAQKELLPALINIQW